MCTHSLRQGYVWVTTITYPAFHGFLWKSTFLELNSLDFKPGDLHSLLTVLVFLFTCFLNVPIICFIACFRGTVEDTELIDGLVFSQRTAGYGGPNKVEKAKIGLIQFCISPPKTDMDNQVVVSDYTQMDRVLREERQYILNIVKQIKKAGCNVLLIQKSILR